MIALISMRFVTQNVIKIMAKGQYSWQLLYLVIV